MADWGGDYSLLIHSVEGRLSQYISSSPSKPASSPVMAPTDIGMISTGKRRKTYDPDADHGGEFNASEKIRMTAELDEAMLLNEQLRDKARDIEGELLRFREKTVKQLAFLEAENLQLKKEARERTDHYYEEKKKWQTKLRELDAECEAFKKGNSRSTKEKPISNSSISRENSTVVESKIADLEKAIGDKTKEVKSLMESNVELEERCCSLRQEIVLLKSRIGQQEQAEDDVLETRDLKKRCAELEVSLRRKTREYDRLVSKIENQGLIEQELNSVGNKLKLAQDMVESGKSIQVMYNNLVNEKKEWTLLFKEIINDSEEQFSEVSPAAVLRVLSSAQKRCATLLKTVGELEVTVSDLRKQLATSEDQLAAVVKGKEESDFQVERLTSRYRLAQQQTKLYEGEVVSLRALMQSFDAEFGIGRPKPADNALLKKKDEIITSLRTELDSCRRDAVELAQRADEAEKKLSAQKGGSGSNNEESSSDVMKQMRAREEELKEELRAFQTYCGVDCLPGSTRVLHFINNPAAAAMGTRSISTDSSYPRDRLKHLTRLLKSTVASSNKSDSAIEDTNGNAVDQSMNLAAGHVTSGGHSSSSADSNKLNQRLKEMFKERITSFREAVYLLTGYKVDLYAADSSTGGHARLRLRSMYAENPDDSLLFQWKGESLELMETPFASKLDPKLFAYLSSCNSVPAFLSNVTLELFDNQTFLG